VGENMSRKEAWKEVVDKVLLRLSKWKRKLFLSESIFNGQDHKSRKASWVKWDNGLTSRDKGGLGVASLYVLNKGLMFKWIWRFYSQKSSLWTRVIKAIHGDDGSVIKELFLRLYALELYKYATVRMKLMSPSLDNSFRRRVRSGAEESLFNSLLEMQVINLVPCEDRYF
nr:RNA-directed DNA polymerase, eukaryota [Tanacetum cinerariifolium]